MKKQIRLSLYLILMACALAGCTHPIKKNPERASNNEISSPLNALFADTQKTNTSEIFKKWIKTASQNPNNPEPLFNIGYGHMQTSFKQYNAHERELAVAYFNEVLKIVPGNHAVLEALYEIYYDNTYHNRTADAFEKASALFKELPEGNQHKLNPPSLAKYAATFNWQEKNHQFDHQKLRDILLNAIHENPVNDSAYIQLSKIYVEDRYFSLALATLKLGEENIHDSAELYQAIAATYNKRAEAHGCNYEQPKDIVNAAKYYKLAVPLDPNNAEIHYSLSESFLDQNLKQLGLHEAAIALNINNKPDDYATNAQNYSLLGNNQKANALFQEAITKGYNSGESTHHEIYMNQGDWVGAAKGFDSYIKSRESFTVYDLIKGDIIAQQSNKPTWIMSKKITTNSSWEEALLNYWSAKSTAEDLNKVAHNRCEKTEYYFYTGYKDLQAGQTSKAKEKFSAALNQNTYRFIERPLARYFLARP